MSGEAEVSTAGEQLTRISLTGGNDKAIDQKTTTFKKKSFLSQMPKKTQNRQRNIILNTCQLILGLYTGYFCI